MLTQKEIDKLCIQGCVNTYKGVYGEVKTIPVQNLKWFEETQPETITKWEKVSNNPKMKFLKRPKKITLTRKVEGFTGNIDNTGIIILQGSHDEHSDTIQTTDWKDNFNFMKKENPFNSIYSNIEIHTGFWLQFQVALKHCKKTITKYNNIILTGHSLGGVIVTIMALWIKIFYPEKHVTCVSFGAPRGGNKAFVKAFNKLVNTSRRYVYDKDFFCNVPPWVLGYRHVTKEIILNASKWWEYIIHPITSLVGNPFHHYPNKYLKAINK